MSTPDLLAAVAALAPLAFVINWVVEALKDATNQNWNGLTTRGGALVGSFGVVSLFAHTPWADSVQIGSHVTLSTVNWAVLALISLAIAAGGGTLTDVLRTVNRSDPTVIKSLLPSATPTPTGPVPTSPDPVLAAMQAQIAAINERLQLPQSS